MHCPNRNYANINRARITAMINDLRGIGARISGDNPWSIDTCRHGVHIKAEWREASGELSVTITNSAWYVSPGDVWKTVDPFIRT